MSGCETDWNVFLKTLIISSSKIVETSSELISTSSELISTGSELISTGSELISTGSELIRIIAELLIISVFKKRKHRYRARWNLGKGCPKRSVLIFNSVMSFGKIHRVFIRGYQRGEVIRGRKPGGNTWVYPYIYCFQNACHIRANHNRAKTRVIFAFILIGTRQNALYFNGFEAPALTGRHGFKTIELSHVYYTLAQHLPLRSPFTIF